MLVTDRFYDAVMQRFDQTPCHEAPHPMEVGMTQSPPDKKKLVVFGLCVAGASLFMYVSFIAKVVFDGP
jgi:hypothetical protein